MAEIISKYDYEQQVNASRDRRMQWWREARFGMFIHFGLYSQLGANEWAMALENWDVKEYEKLADTFLPEPGAPRKWAELAKKAGMKYMVLTTRHHEGFSLWDSKVNPYNSVNYGCKRDIVREFVDACREFDLKIGFYTSLMDWHHPDGGRAAYDTEARKRFTDYIWELNRELLTNYGKIDILWYDVARPMENWEGWDSLTRNQKLRELQPDIIINNRSRLDEDFSTPEEQIVASGKDWEACMTFNGISWGYIDPVQAQPYCYNAQTILKMLAQVTSGGGNLLLNIGPAPDGSVPSDAIEPLTTVGKWLEKNGAAVYGKKMPSPCHGTPNGTSVVTWDGEHLYVWNRIAPPRGELILGGFATPLKSVRLLSDGTSVQFKQEHQRIIIKTPDPDPIANVTVYELTFDGEIRHERASLYPPLHGGAYPLGK
ncbi:MAG: alpha-L-fucosidase [Candidatus Merdivicinus sp.]